MKKHFFSAPSAYQQSPVRMPLDSMKKSPVIASVFSSKWH